MRRCGAMLSLVLLLVLLGARGGPVGAQDTYDCGDFQFQEDAQAVYDADPSDPYGLDGPIGPTSAGVPGVACEDLPSRGTAGPEPPPVEPEEPVEPSRPDLATCGAFAAQPDAQAALDAGQVDPSIVDSDGDGIACEELLGAPDDTGTGGGELVTICVGTGGESMGPAQTTRDEYDARVAEGQEPILPDANGNCPGIRVVPNVCHVTPDGTYEHIAIQSWELEEHLAANPDDFEQEFHAGPCPAVGPDNPDPDTDAGAGEDTPATDDPDAGQGTSPDGDGSADDGAGEDGSGGEEVVPVRAPRVASGGEAEVDRLPVIGAPSRTGGETDGAGELPDEVPANTTEAEVVRVVDGDTVEVEVTEDGHPEEGEEKTVRLILIDTPETRHPTRGVECFGREATQQTTGMLKDRTVYLERDVSNTDRYGRLLRYVWFERGERAELANELLVRRGYAVLSTYPPDVKYVEPIRAAEREAREAGVGLWGECGGADTPLDADEDATDARRVEAPEREPEPVAEADPAPRTETTGGEGCDPSYPDLCVPVGAADLDCDDIGAKNIVVLPPDPHGFDGNDNDGVGCESG